jgi:hypothetical protein
MNYMHFILIPIISYQALMFYLLYKIKQAYNVPSLFIFSKTFDEEQQNRMIDNYATILRKNLRTTIEYLKRSFNKDVNSLEQLLNSSSIEEKIDTFIEKTKNNLHNNIDWSINNIERIDMRQDIIKGSNLICSEINECLFTDNIIQTDYESFRVIYDSSSVDKSDATSGEIKLVLITIVPVVIYFNKHYFYKIKDIKPKNYPYYFLIEYLDDLYYYLYHSITSLIVSVKETDIVTGNMVKYIMITHDPTYKYSKYENPDESQIKILITEYFKNEEEEDYDLI